MSHSTLQQWAAATVTGEGPLKDAIREVKVTGAMLTTCMYPVTNEPTQATVQDALDACADLIGALRMLSRVL